MMPSFVTNMYTVNNLFVIVYFILESVVSFFCMYMNVGGGSGKGFLTERNTLFPFPYQWTISRILHGRVGCQTFIFTHEFKNPENTVIAFKCN